MRGLRQSRFIRAVQAGWIISLVLAPGVPWALEVDERASGYGLVSSASAEISLSAPQLPPVKNKLDGPLIVEYKPSTTDKSVSAAKPSKPKQAVVRADLPARTPKREPKPAPALTVETNQMKAAKRPSEPETYQSSGRRKPSGKSVFGSQQVRNGYALFDHGDAAPRLEPRSTVTWMTVFAIMTRLVIVAILAYCTLLGLKWFLNRQHGGNAGGSRRSGLSLAGTVSLGSNRSIHIIRAGGRDFLIGATGGSVNLLAEIGESPDGEPKLEEASFENLIESYAVSGTDTAAKTIAGKLRGGAALLHDKAKSLRHAATTGEGLNE